VHVKSLGLFTWVKFASQDWLPLILIRYSIATVTEFFVIYSVLRMD